VEDKFFVGGGLCLDNYVSYFFEGLNWTWGS